MSYRTLTKGRGQNLLPPKKRKKNLPSHSLVREIIEQPCCSSLARSHARSAKARSIVLCATLCSRDSELKRERTSKQAKSLAIHRRFSDSADGHVVAAAAAAVATIAPQTANAQKDSRFVDFRGLLLLLLLHFLLFLSSWRYSYTIIRSSAARHHQRGAPNYLLQYAPRSTSRGIIQTLATVIAREISGLSLRRILRCPPRGSLPVPDRAGQTATTATASHSRNRHHHRTPPHPAHKRGRNAKCQQQTARAAK